MTLEQAIAEVQKLVDAMFARGQAACTPAEFQALYQAWTVIQAAANGALPQEAEPAPEPDGEH